MNGHGGKREGAGYPKGVKWPSTLRKEEARELVRRYVTERLPEYLDASASISMTFSSIRFGSSSSGRCQRMTNGSSSASVMLICSLGLSMQRFKRSVKAWTL